MPYMADRQSVVANAVVANTVSGKSQEFVRVPSRLRFGVNASAVGLYCTILVGNEVIVEDQEVSAANRTPIDPDDFNYESGGHGGDRIVVKLRNSTGGAITGWTAVKIEELV